MTRSAAKYEMLEFPAIAGRLVIMTDRDYDALRVTAFDVRKRPAALARVADAADIAAVVAFAGRHGTDLAVRSGGHSVMGHGNTDGGIVVDLRVLKGIDLDLEARTVWAGTGLTAGELTQALEPHGLVVGFGDSGAVGIGGITLGGGIGYLSRKFGLSIDSLLAAEVVLANGDVVIADERQHPDLFWALRGGGGNFGIVSRLKFRLNELPEFTGGRLVLPATAETIAGFVRAADTAPDALTTIANIMPAPPLPFLPAEAEGKPVIMAMMAFAGPADEAQRALAPFRTLAKPMFDLVKSAPYSAMFEPASSDYHPTVASQSFFPEAINESDAGKMIDFMARAGSGMRVVQLRVLGRAIARVAADATAYGHRDRRIMANIAAFYDGEKNRPAAQLWADDLAAALGRGGGTYVNFLMSDRPHDIEAAYPAQIWARLRQVKRVYDPENLFRLNHNIPPA